MSTSLPAWAKRFPCVHAAGVRANGEHATVEAGRISRAKRDGKARGSQGRCQGQFTRSPSGVLPRARPHGLEARRKSRSHGERVDCLKREDNCQDSPSVV